VIAKLLARFRSSPDREHEMSLNRLIFLSLIAAYTFWINSSVPREALISATVFAFISAGIVVHILVRPHQSTIRRIIAIVCDLTTLSFQLRYVGETSSVLFLLYLWITFGNGFRFGVRFLYIAMAVSAVCFSAVIYTTPRWHDDIYLSATLLLSLIVLPLYASTLIRKLSNAKAQAEAAYRAKTLFLASVSHELRTPLNAIIGLSSLMAGTKLDVEQRGIIRTIGSAGDTLLRQINSILNLSRIEAGQMPLEKVDYDLLEVLSTARAMMLAQAQQRGLRLTIHVAPGTPSYVHGSRHHLEEILLNLLGNAVKFTDSGYITLDTRPLNTDKGSFIRFAVSDTGIGIAPRAIGRIFESFTQADETIINRYGGTGLGLSICRQLITAMGGTIGVDSEEGHGSSFWFTLPVGIPDQKNPAQPLLNGFRPLLICSSMDLASSIASRLGGPDQVPVARTPAEARDYAKQHSAAEWLIFYYSDLPEELLADEIEQADLTANPVLIRSDPSKIASSTRLMRLSSSLLPLDFTGEDARVASIAAAMQTSSAQSIWRGPSDIELPTASRRLSILVADDNSTNRLVITKILERGGHSTRCVANGEDVLDALATESFDLVIMDINMPVMTGLEATKIFRFTEPSGVRMPIFALTADATPEIAARTLEAGMDACLTKTVQPAALLRLIEERVGSQSDALPLAIDEALITPSTVQTPLVDEPVLAELEQLGGRDFVLSLVDEFFLDANQLIDELRSAAASGDSHRFRLEAHGLQSASANVGARTVHEICVGWRKITSADLLRNGSEQVEHLALELERTHTTLKQYLTVGSHPTKTTGFVQQRFGHPAGSVSERQR
jgi:two-component system, sensor histidine kinase RpfC